MKIAMLGAGSGIRLTATTNQARALEGAAYVITSCAIRRAAFWIQDFRIAERSQVRAA